MDRPLVLEVNTRCWLDKLSVDAGHAITLASAPETEFLSWQKNGFTHIWLMGVWTTGSTSRAISHARPDLATLATEAFGAQGKDFIAGSPYAIADYTVSEDFGGTTGLRHFRAKLREHGIRLILDFVHNHVGLDHPWLKTRISLFIHGQDQEPEMFPVTNSGRTTWVAHGKDPYFPAWSDTAQLDYRNPSTQHAMVEALESVANECDGVRCDMAMLGLSDIFDKTWHNFQREKTGRTNEFWPDAIAKVRKTHPRFLFIAEAYWNLEPRLHALGFDYVYDKTFFDYLTRRDFETLQAHVSAPNSGFNPVRFLENHDEPRIAATLSQQEHEAAAIFLLRQPGMRLLHDGQLTGRKRRTPVEFARYWPESPDSEITDFYNAILLKKNF